MWNRDTLRNIRLTATVPLRAGEKTPIRIEYVRMAAGYLHLSWESRSQETEHVPTACLYPVEGATTAAERKGVGK